MNDSTRAMVWTFWRGKLSTKISKGFHGLVGLIVSLFLVLMLPAPALAGVVTLDPNGVGNFDQWVLGAGETKVAAVSSPNDGDTSYVKASTQSYRQTFTFLGAGVPPGSTINSVTITIVAKRAQDAGANIRLTVGRGAPASDISFGENQNPPKGDYGPLSRTMTTNPLTLGAWTVSEVNNWQTADGSPIYFGVEHNQSQAGREARVTQISVAVNYTLPPAVTTNNVTNIQPTTATANGNITETGGENATRRGFKYGLSQVDTWDVFETGGFGTGAYSLNLTGLTPNTTYWIRAYATNLAGTSYGSWVSFATLPSIPSVTTIAATNVEETTATLNGNITAINDTSATERGFDWDINSGEPYANSWTETGSWGTGSFSNNLTGLTEGQLYYFRAIVKNNLNNWGYGSELTFLTKPDAPTNFTATPGNGQVSLSWSKGAGANQTLIVRKVGSYPADRSDGTQVYFDTGTSHTDTGLINGTAYYYCAWSEVTADTLQQYSDDKAQAQATPTALPPAVTTNDGTNVTTTGARLNGNLDNLGTAFSVKVSFQWGASSGTYPYETTSQARTATGAFGFDLSGLTAGTTYYFRAKAVGDGTSYGGEKSFTALTAVPPQCIGTATGSGTACFSFSLGNITNLTTVAEGTLPTAGKPMGATFPHGMFSFNITNIAPGSAVTVTIALPLALPIGTQYWKYQAGTGWFEIPIGDDDGDNVITIQLTDGGLGDADGLANGTIVDPGGPAIQSSAAKLSKPRASAPMPMPPYFSVQYLTVDPPQTYPNQPVEISLNVANSGGSYGGYTVNLMINGKVEGTKTVSVAPGSASPVKFTVYKAQPGTYNVSIDGQQSSFTILGTTTPTTATGGWSLGSGGVIAVIIIGIMLLLGIIFVLPRMMRGR